MQLYDSRASVSTLLSNVFVSGYHNLLLSLQITWLLYQLCSTELYLQE